MAITLGQAAPIKHSCGPARGGRPGPLTSKASTLLPHHFCQVPDWWKNSIFWSQRGGAYWGGMWSVPWSSSGLFPQGHSVPFLPSDLKAS